jgi:hypothetical protein
MVLGVFLLAGCTSTLLVNSPTPLEPGKGMLQAEQPERFWWRVRFKLIWPEGEQPDFSRHLLIAEQLYMPTISSHESEIPLWRFHRRAARGDAGNQFSLIFFSDAATAEQLNEDIVSNPLTDWLLDQGMIDKVRFGKHSKEELGLLEQSSDPSWPMEIQRSWPYFIMGVSQSWLVLIQELSGEIPLEGNVSYDELLDHYQKVDLELSAQWREYGQHAYLHHLSAVFGYEPIKLRATEMRRF